MSLDKLKYVLEHLEDEEKESDGDESSLEVIADSIAEALDLAADELGVEVDQLDYKVLQRGTRGVLGIGRTPYRLLVNTLSHEEMPEGLEDDLNLSLSKGADDADEMSMDSLNDRAEAVEPKNKDGYARVKVLRSGIWLWVYPPVGDGKQASVDDAIQKIVQLGLSKVDMDLVEQAVKANNGDGVKLGEWRPNPELDSSVFIEVSEDEMKAWAHVTPPRGAGRHLEYDDILRSLEAKSVVACINHEIIKSYLDKADYSQPLEAATGIKPQHGKDAQIDYKVRISKEIKLEEDDTGRVNFANLDLVENVVVGQVLAVKVPAQEGIAGRTVTNRVLEAKDGRDGQIRHSKGTILSEDGMTLTAEINGEVIYSHGRISVHPVKTIVGDVGTSTGNIIFLGSVVITGSVQDNFSVKAAGNIEVRGSIQKAHLEAEGDIIIRGGIQGREDGYVESTGGNIYAKFIQSSRVITEGNIIVAEGILHSRLDAGGHVLCNGKRAQIVGGVIRAGREVKAKTIGSEAFTNTEIRVGFNPKLLQRVQDMESTKLLIEEKLEKADQTIKYLQGQKKIGGDAFNEEKAEKLERLEKGKVKYQEKIADIENDLGEIKQYMVVLDHSGIVSVDKTIWPNVIIYIQHAYLSIKDEYNHVSFVKRGEDVAIVGYQEDEKEKKKKRRGRRGKKK